MAIDNINDGVGKKIVEALRMQAEGHTEGDVFVNDDVEDVVETQPVVEEIEEQKPAVFQDVQPEFVLPADDVPPVYNNEEEVQDLIPHSPLKFQSQSQPQPKVQVQQAQPQAQIQPQSFVDTAFNQSLARNLGTDTFSAYNEEFDYPPNVAVLKQLIAKLPSGVSKQTGAIIIKQTMEALGISMGSVLQEAKQFQDNLTNNSIECKNNILEYRKQISVLEAKAQQYQRQSALMNDIISLFVQSK
jgi:hypothetical protein